MKIRIIAILFALVCLLCACSETGAAKTVCAYGFIQGTSICEVTVEADKSDKIIGIRIEEYYLPNTMMKTNNYVDGIFTADNKASVVTSSGTENEYVKYIDIDGENFTLFTTEIKDENDASYEPKRYAIDYQSDKKTSLNTYISTDDGGKWYVHGLKAGNITVGKMEEDKYYPLATATQGGGISKSTTGYWSTDLEGSLGWALNIQLIQTQLLKEFNKSDVGSVDDSAIENMKIDSGATLTGFADYIKIAYKAFEKIASA